MREFDACIIPQQKIGEFKHIYIKDNQVFHTDVFERIDDFLSMSRPIVGEYVSFEFERYKELKRPKEAGFFGKVAHNYKAEQVRKETSQTVERYYKVISILHSGNHPIIRFYIKEVNADEIGKDV